MLNSWVLNFLKSDSGKLLRTAILLYSHVGVTWYMRHDHVIATNNFVRVRPFFKLFRHKSPLVELDELNRIIPEFLKLDNWKLLLAGVLCLAT